MPGDFRNWDFSIKCSAQTYQCNEGKEAGVLIRIVSIWFFPEVKTGMSFFQCKRKIRKFKI